MPGSYVLPTLQSPLPQERRYKLQMRCRSCLTDSYPIACLGMKRLTPREVDGRVLEFARRLRITCPACEQAYPRLVAYFPVRNGHDGAVDNVEI